MAEQELSPIGGFAIFIIIEAFLSVIFERKLFFYYPSADLIIGDLIVENWAIQLVYPIIF